MTKRTGRLIVVVLGVVDAALIAWIVIMVRQGARDLAQREARFTQMESRIPHFLSLAEKASEVSAAPHEGGLVVIDLSRRSLQAHRMLCGRTGDQPRAILAEQPEHVKGLVLLSEHAPVYVATYRGGIYVKASWGDSLFEFFERTRSLPAYRSSTDAAILDLATGRTTARRTFEWQRSLPQNIAEFEPVEREPGVYGARSLNSQGAYVPMGTIELLRDASGDPYGIKFHNPDLLDELWKWILASWRDQP